MNKKPPVRTMRWSFGLAISLGLICVSSLVTDRKELAVSVGTVALFFAVIGIGAMTLCDLRRRPPHT